MKTVIAIDGPAASGKSSVARKLADTLGFSLVNSGSFYRVVTWWVLQSQLPFDQPAQITAALEKAHCNAGFSNTNSFFKINDLDGEGLLHSEEVNRAVSSVARLDIVRSLVTSHLRALASERDVVVEGRDIGSVVFPETRHKFYIDASPEVRQQRRAAQGQQDMVAERDRVDSSRTNAPLTVAPGAVVIDSTHLPVEGVVAEILRLLPQQGLPVPAK